MKLRVSLSIVLLTLVLAGSCDDKSCDSFFCGISGGDCGEPTPTPNSSAATCNVTTPTGSGPCNCTLIGSQPASGKGDYYYCFTCTRINGGKESFITRETAGNSDRARQQAEASCE